MKSKIESCIDCIISFIGLVAVMTIDFVGENTVQLIILSFAALYQFARLAMADRKIAPVQMKGEIIMREIKFRGKRVKDGKWIESYSPLGTFTWDFIPKTVGQYTGLKDKNGNKIYEGDIVKELADCNELGESLYYTYQIRWNEEHCAFEGYELLAKESVLMPDLQDIEVIGNIYDNPEILKNN
ncbi:MAG: YopX family protein [Clostridium sp.]|nr:YopX family protein [Clostridium sp.]MCM1208989.1 YopX family protein [Ruminococcus sp.]